MSHIKTTRAEPSRECRGEDNERKQKQRWLQLVFRHESVHMLLYVTASNDLGVFQFVLIAPTLLLVDPVQNDDL